MVWRQPKFAVVAVVAQPAGHPAFHQLVLEASEVKTLNLAPPHQEYELVEEKEVQDWTMVASVVALMVVLVVASVVALVVALVVEIAECAVALMVALMVEFEAG